MPERRHKNNLNMAVPPNQLEAIGAIGDINPSHKDYAARLGYQNAIIATNHHDRHSGIEFFNTVQPTNNHAERCNMISPIVICSATIAGAGPGGANVTLNPETYTI